MKWYGFGSESPFGLHCTNWYEPSNYLVCRSSNLLATGFTIGINLNLMLPSLDRTNESINAVTRNHTQRGRGINTHNTLTHVPIHARHTCIHTRVHPHTYRYMSIHTHILYIHTHIWYTLYTHTPPKYTYAWLKKWAQCKVSLSG